MPDFIYLPPQQPATIIYEDSDILVVEKLSGLLSVPGRLPQHQDNLIGRLEINYGKLHCVHRLDMDTSGLMVIARNKPALSKLSKQFQLRTVKKIYQAIVSGLVENDQGVIEEPLITDWPNRPRQKICFEEGKPSKTEYRVIKREDYTSYVELYPVTGRSHQLRIHMQSIGHPILGCRFYAHTEAQNASSRLMLHASHLAFNHPVTEKCLEFSRPAEFWLNQVDT